MDAATDYTDTIRDPPRKPAPRKPTPRKPTRAVRWFRALRLVLRALRRPAPARPDPQEERMLLIARHRPPI